MAKTRIFVLGAAVASAVGLAACTDERAITSEPVGPLGFGINLAKEAINIPRGYMRLGPATPTANPANDSIIVVLRGLDSLPAGTRYRVWVADDSSTTWFPVTGARLTVTKTDTTFDSAGDPVFTPRTTVTTGVDGFSNGGANAVIRFASSRGAVAGLGSSPIGVGLVTIETAASPTTPNPARRIIWSRRSERVGTTDSAFVRFGTFGKSLATQYVFSATTNAGNANMTINPRGRVEVRGPVMVVNDSNYWRPPQGYYYAAYAIKLDTIRGRFQDTVYLGRRTTPWPEQISLYDADFGQATNPAPNIVLEPQQVILGMRTRVSADSIPKAQGTPPWREFGQMVVTLESKEATEGRMGPAIIMNATLPKSIRGR
jgi:hypothetical protein